MSQNLVQGLNPVNHLRWRVLLLCFLAQNCAMGFAFGSFGPMLASTEQHFGVSRAVASTGMGVIMLGIGGLSPFLGGLLQRTSIRAGMAVGALLSAAGYWGLAFMTDFPVALLMFSLVGVGVCLLAILGPLTLISRWFDSHRGKMLSVVNLPIMLFLTPYLVSEVLPRYGRFAMLGFMGTICALLLPLILWWVVEYPPAAHRAGVANSGRVSLDGGTLGTILKRPEFWLLSLGIGIMAGTGSGFVVHIVPFGMAKQMTLQSASALLSIYAGAGILGTLLFGWISDRIGPPAALVFSSTCQALLWWGLAHASGAPLFVLAGLLGICVVPLVTLHGAALSQMFDAASVSRAMGYSYSIKLPFIFSFAPALGLMFDRLGQYERPFVFTTCLLAVSVVCFYFMTLIVRRKSALLVAHAST